VKKIVELLALRCLQQALCHDCFLDSRGARELETIKDFSDQEKKLT
jgi:hypothetical protein